MVNEVKSLLEPKQSKHQISHLNFSFSGMHVGIKFKAVAAVVRHWLDLNSSEK